MHLATVSNDGAFPPPIPTPWASKLIGRLKGLYGAQFDRQWEGVKAENLITVWAEELAGYTGPEIARGLEGCRSKKFPPTIPEFLLMCRPELDAATAHQEAVQGVEARRRGEVGQWSHPAVYWASVKVGQHDLLNMGWQAIKGRWEKALREQFAKGEWDPVPAPAVALPAPGKTLVTKEEAAARLAEMGAGQVVNPKTNHRAWIDRVLEREKRGEKVPHGVLKAAKDAAAMTGAAA